MYLCICVLGWPVINAPITVCMYFCDMSSLQDRRDYKKFIEQMNTAEWAPVRMALYKFTV